MSTIGINQIPAHLDTGTRYQPIRLQLWSTCKTTLLKYIRCSFLFIFHYGDNHIISFMATVLNFPMKGSLSCFSYRFRLNMDFIKVPSPLLYSFLQVQTGFGRLGSHFWGFETHGVVPDIGTNYANLVVVLHCTLKIKWSFDFYLTCTMRIFPLHLFM